MPNLHNKLIAYFKSCYQEDTRDIQLMNFFGQKVENRLMLDDFDLISGKSLLYPVPTDWGKKAQTELTIHGKEKGLYAFSMFLVGNGSVAGRKQKVVAPLLLHPLELHEKDEIFYLSFKDMENEKAYQELIINPFISRLTKSENDTKKVLNDLHAELNNNFIGFDQCNKIHDIIQANFNEIDTSELLAFPKIFDDKKILELVNFQNDGNFVLIPGCGVGFMKKSKYSRGILNELEVLGNTAELSEPLIELLNQKIEPKKIKTDEPIFAPRLLSHAQAQVCRSAHTNTTTVIQGPPGTGKSYTIAAIAADAVAMGYSVLIASKSDQAIQVVNTKIEEDMELKSLPILASRSNYLEEAKVQVKKLLSQRKRYAGLNRLNLIEYRLIQINKDIEEIEKEYIKREKEEIKNGIFLYKKQGWFYNFRKRRLKNRVFKKTPLKEILLKYYDLLKERNRLVIRYISLGLDKKRKYAYEHHAEDMRNFSKSLTANTGTKREGLFTKINFKGLLNALPIWLVNTKDVHSIMPLEKELFDLVIIDEATQCDMASMIPILQRGKKAIIVGDTNQLRHISFVSKQVQENLAKNHDIISAPEKLRNYRNYSLLDMAIHAHPENHELIVLNEHYRSQPDIIQFSNQEYYEHGMNIMTSNPITNKEKNLHLHYTTGTREKNGVNKTEAKAIVDFIENLIDEQNELNPEINSSIGILSPFRNQVDYLKDYIITRIGIVQFETHNILIGTPYAFQGEERDIMLISLTVDENTPSSTLRYLTKSDVFNVSITRARDEQHVFISCPIHHIKNQGTLFHYLKQIESPNPIEKRTDYQDYYDDFMDEVYSYLESKGIQTILKDYEVASVLMDIVIVHNGETKVIDLVGFPGQFEGIYHFEEYRLLSRVGIRVFPISYSTWIFQKESTLMALDRFLDLEED